MTATAVPARERPILFSGEMVRAILEGRKTQTRRVVRPQPEFFRDGPGWVSWRHGKRLGAGKSEAGWAAHAIDRCPYGNAGDRLWVRETWGLLGHVPMSLRRAGLSQRHLRYRADWQSVAPGNTDWKPSIHMPRWASRITLEITGVRAERVQDITRADAIAEGVESDEFMPTPEREFARLWDDLNAERGYGWNVNPWVWAISFVRAQTGRLHA